MRLAVVNLKGVTGKTTSATALACVLAKQDRVLLVDADPQASALGWVEEVEFPFPTVGLPIRDLHKQLGKIATDHDHVVIDTPLGHEALVRAAVLAADTVLIPLAPAGVELRQVGPTFALLAELESHAPALQVLLTQVQARTVAGRSARAVLAAAQVPLLAAEVPQRQGYRTAFGALPPTQHYKSVLAELLAAA